MLLHFRRALTSTRRDSEASQADVFRNDCRTNAADQCGALYVDITMTESHDRISRDLNLS